MKIVNIVNPHSGNGHGAIMGKEIENICKELQLQYEMRYTTKCGDAIHIASEYTKDDTLLISIGGDGTMNEIVNGMHENVTLGIMPCGSGNDFYRIIDAKTKTLRDTYVAILQGEMKKVDVACVNNRKFLGSFSLGLDANVVNEAKRIQDKNPKVHKSAYVRALLHVIHKRECVHTKITYDGQMFEQDSLLISCLNGEYYGGGFHPCPQSIIDDGKVCVNVVEQLSLGQILRLLPSYTQGKHYKAKQVKYFETNQFTIELDRPIVYQVDGELFQDASFTIEVFPKALQLIIPKKEG